MSDLEQLHLRATGAALLLREGVDYPEADVLAALGVSQRQVQAACGELGHTWEEYSNGDPSGPFFETYSACNACGAPYEPRYD